VGRGESPLQQQRLVATASFGISSSRVILPRRNGRHAIHFSEDRMSNVESLSIYRDARLAHPRQLLLGPERGIPRPFAMIGLIHWSIVSARYAYNGSKRSESNL